MTCILEEYTGFKRAARDGDLTAKLTVPCWGRGGAGVGFFSTFSLTFRMPVDRRIVRRLVHTLPDCTVKKLIPFYGGSSSGRMAGALR